MINNRCRNEILINNNHAIIICNSPKFGKFQVLIDTEDIPKIKNYYWNVRQDGHCKSKFYVQTTDKHKRIHLHRFLLNLQTFTNNTNIDHINGNTLDNRKNNLRICTHKENMQNIQISKRSKSGIKNISWCNSLQKWRIYYNKKYIGCCKTIEQAKEKLDIYKRVIA